MQRQKQLTTLISLSALSAVALYVVQGALATGADVTAFPAWFWVLDYALWAARALIEAAVIVFLFSTTPGNKSQSRILAAFEIALIALITLTVGPALRAVGQKSTMVDSLTPTAFTAWSFGIAAYTSLMVGAAGYAYRVQPSAAPSTAYADLAARNEQLVNEIYARTQEIEQLTRAVDAWGLLNATERAAVIARCANGDRPDAAELAQALNASVSTVRRGYGIVDGEQ